MNESGAVRKALGVLRLAALLIGIVLAWQAGPAGARKISGAYDGLESCGNDLITAQACPTCDAFPAFELDGYWHKLAQCARDIGDLWRKRGPLYRTDMPGSPTVAELARAEIVQEMTRPRVMFLSAGRALAYAEVFDRNLAPRRAISHVVLTNDLGQAYNGMGQSGLALRLYHLAALAERGGYGDAARDAEFYRVLARGAIRTVLSPVARGGLASARPCALAPEESCIWYHSLTRRDRPGDAGGTLNQMLHVVRDLGAIARLSDKQGWAEPFDFEAAVTGGLNQMFLAGAFAGPGSTPNLADFISDETGPNGAPWAWYGFNLRGNRARPGYFLKQPAKNCSYHMHVLQLLETILERAEKSGRAGAALTRAFAPGSALPEFIRAARDAALGQVSPRLDCTGKSATRSRQVIKDLRRLQKRLAR